MGLGKTVEALAAAELRRAVPWAIGYGAAPRAVAVCVEISQCVGAGVASMAWRKTRRFSTNAP